MTRLKTSWIEDMKDTVSQWNITLSQKTGMDLMGLAAKATNMPLDKLIKRRANVLVSVVPITSGLGVIGQFAQSVEAIIKSMGFQCFVTSGTDVDGIYEAKTKGANIVFMADDNRYLAFNLDTGQVGENDISTANGYVTALEAMIEKTCGGYPWKEDVLVLGYGRVGRQIEKCLQAKKIDLTIYDQDLTIQNELKAKGKKYISQKCQIKNYRYILDATSTGPWLSKEDLNDETIIAAPGIPYSLDKEAADLYENTSVHDQLEIGTAVMLAYGLGGNYE